MNDFMKSFINFIEYLLNSHKKREKCRVVFDPSVLCTLLSRVFLLFTACLSKKVLSSKLRAFHVTSHI